MPKQQQNKLNKTTKLIIQIELVSSMENKGRDNWRKIYIYTNINLQSNKIFLHGDYKYI